MKHNLFDELPRTVRIRDMTLRDGLQSIKRVLSTESKLELYEALVSAGVRDLQVTSFVNAALVPQLADAAELWAAVSNRPERLSVLVANMRGFDRALAAGAREIEAVVSLSDTYNGKNARRSTRQSLDEINLMARHAQESGCKLTVALANSYHCVFEGWMKPSRVLDAIGELRQNGVLEIGICDTTGYATPDRVFHLSASVIELFPDMIFGTHLHDTRGRGIVNAIAALSAGITWFDTALAGLGGSLFAPGMGGNLSSETLIDTLTEMGIQTGINSRRIMEVGGLVQTMTRHATVATTS